MNFNLSAVRAEGTRCLFPRLFAGPFARAVTSFEGQRP